MSTPRRQVLPQEKGDSSSDADITLFKLPDTLRFITHCEKLARIIKEIGRFTNEKRKKSSRPMESHEK
jgi:hypothetical protein